MNQRPFSNYLRDGLKQIERELTFSAPPIVFGPGLILIKLSVANAIVIKTPITGTACPAWRFFGSLGLTQPKILGA